MHTADRNTSTETETQTRNRVLSFQNPKHKLEYSDADFENLLEMYTSCIAR